VVRGRGEEAMFCEMEKNGGDGQFGIDWWMRGDGDGERWGE
jgi:hypothetical protein